MADSFGTKHNAEKYAGGANYREKKPEQYQAILILRKHRSGKDLRPLYDTITTVQQDPVTPTHLEAESFFIAGTRFEVVSVQRYDLPNGGKRDVYTLREL